MAKRSNKSSKQKPNTMKAAYTRNNSSRKYNCGGKLSKKSK